MRSIAATFRDLGTRPGHGLLPALACIGLVMLGPIVITMVAVPMADHALRTGELVNPFPGAGPWLREALTPGQCWSIAVEVNQGGEWRYVPKMSDRLWLDRDEAIERSAIANRELAALPNGFVPSMRAYPSRLPCDQIKGK